MWEVRHRPAGRPGRSAVIARLAPATAAYAVGRDMRERTRPPKQPLQSSAALVAPRERQRVCVRRCRNPDPERDRGARPQRLATELRTAAGAGRTGASLARHGGRGQDQHRGQAGEAAREGRRWERERGSDDGTGRWRLASQLQTETSPRARASHTLWPTERSPAPRLTDGPRS
jgi:hypothetical protein